MLTVLTLLRCIITVSSFLLTDLMLTVLALLRCAITVSSFLLTNLMLTVLALLKCIITVSSFKTMYYLCCCYSEVYNTSSSLLIFILKTLNLSLILLSYIRKKTSFLLYQTILTDCIIKYKNSTMRFCNYCITGSYFCFMLEKLNKCEHCI